MAEVYVIGGYGYSRRMLRYGHCHGSLGDPLHPYFSSCMSMSSQDATSSMLKSIFRALRVNAQDDIEFPLSLGIIDDENTARRASSRLKA